MRSFSDGRPAANGAAKTVTGAVKTLNGAVKTVNGAVRTGLVKIKIPDPQRDAGKFPREPGRLASTNTYMSCNS